MSDREVAGVAMELNDLKEFRVERADSGVLHLIFDMPGRAMNVFSNNAIAEIGIFSTWLSQSDVRGVVIRSAKPSGFCAGADLADLGAAYDMIMAAPQGERGRIAFDHFFRLSQAFRMLETAGKPVAVAVAGLALGGGCEFSLAAHHRVLADHPQAVFGLPESLVGLLPGGGGTQRLPRLIGVEAAFPILLDGARLGGEAAVKGGLAHQVVPLGQEVAAAEQWVLSQVSASQPAKQPWDRPDWRLPDAGRFPVLVARKRAEVLAATLGHYPAPLAILDCLDRGLGQPFDDAIRGEMQIFAELIQRREPRNMIRTMFLGRLDHDRQRKNGGISQTVQDAVGAVAAALKVDAGADTVLAQAYARAGFTGFTDAQKIVSGAAASGTAYWFEAKPADRWKAALRERLAAMDAAAAPWRSRLSEEERRAADYLLVKDAGFPAYLGGVFALPPI